MSNERQETVADIVREMRIGDLCAEDTSASRPEYINDFLASYADRIEAAWWREKSAIEATAEKSTAVGNAGTVRDIAQEMLNTSMQAVSAERINGWAMRLAEACEQPVTDCNRLNNAAKMREALNAIKDTLDEWRTNGEMMEHWQYSELFGIANAALSAPPRNCDVGTAEEQGARHSKWCRKYGIDGDMEVACAHQDMSCTLCALRWAQMPYEEGGAE